MFQLNITLPVKIRAKTRYERMWHKRTIDTIFKIHLKLDFETNNNHLHHFGNALSLAVRKKKFQVNINLAV